MHFTKCNINTLHFSLVHLSHPRFSELSQAAPFAWGRKALCILSTKTLCPPLQPSPDLSLFPGRATPRDCRRWPGEVWSIAWAWCSSRVMEWSPLPTPSGTSSWPQQLLSITMPFGSTFTEVLQTSFVTYEIMYISICLYLWIYRFIYRNNLHLASVTVLFDLKNLGESEKLHSKTALTLVVLWTRLLWTDVCVLPLPITWQVL